MSEAVSEPSAEAAEAACMVILNEESRWYSTETGASIMRNRCAFTSTDMAADWHHAFTYAVVFGWKGAWREVAERYEWDDELVAFLKDAHRRFKKLADKTKGAQDDEQQ
jgi:hypothetical protein